MGSAFAVVLSVFSAAFASSDQIASSDSGRYLAVWRNSLFDIFFCHVPEAIFLGPRNCSIMILVSVFRLEFHFLKRLFFSCGFYLVAFMF